MSESEFRRARYSRPPALRPSAAPRRRHNRNNTNRQVLLFPIYYTCERADPRAPHRPSSSSELHCRRRSAVAPCALFFAPPPFFPDTPSPSPGGAAVAASVRAAGVIVGSGAATYGSGAAASDATTFVSPAAAAAVVTTTGAAARAVTGGAAVSTTAGATATGAAIAVGAPTAAGAALTARGNLRASVGGATENAAAGVGAGAVAVAVAAASLPALPARGDESLNKDASRDDAPPRMTGLPAADASSAPPAAGKPTVLGEARELVPLPLTPFCDVSAALPLPGGAPPLAALAGRSIAVVAAAAAAPSAGETRPPTFGPRACADVGGAAAAAGAPSVDGLRGDPVRGGGGCARSGDVVTLTPPATAPVGGEPTGGCGTLRWTARDGDAARDVGVVAGERDGDGETAALAFAAPPGVVRGGEDAKFSRPGVDRCAPVGGSGGDARAMRLAIVRLLRGGPLAPPLPEFAAASDPPFITTGDDGRDGGACGGARLSGASTFETDADDDFRAAAPRSVTNSAAECADEDAPPSSPPAPSTVTALRRFI